MKQQGAKPALRITDTQLLDDGDDDDDGFDGDDDHGPAGDVCEQKRTSVFRLFVRVHCYPNMRSNWGSY